MRVAMVNKIAHDGLPVGAVYNVIEVDQAFLNEIYFVKSPGTKAIRDTWDLVEVRAPHEPAPTVLERAVSLVPIVQATASADIVRGSRVSARDGRGQPTAISP